MTMIRITTPPIRPSTPTAAAPPPRLLDLVRQTVCARHYSRRTEKAYVGWIRRLIFCHGKRHPKEMGSVEIAQFLSQLATRGGVSASTQNQAFTDGVARLFCRLPCHGYPVIPRRLAR
jgi:integrase-like protein